MRTTQKGWGKASGRKAMLLLGMSAMALAFVAMMAGCGDSGGGGGGPPPLPPPQVVAPTATPAAGAVVSGTTITLSATDGADIYYTIDGNTPTASSTRYSSSIPITVTAAVTIKAIAVKSGMTNSEVLSAAYTIADVIITADNLDDMKSRIADIAAADGGASSAEPIIVAIAIADASLLSGTNTSGGTDTLHKLFDAIPSGKYVAYDLSGCTFTSIGDIDYDTANARTNKAYLVSIALPDALTSIGDAAFWSCSGLTSVTIPNSVISIGYAAFNSCTGLTSVTIGNSVISIGYAAFYGCTGLTSVTIPNSVISIGGYVFSECSGLTSVTIADSVTSIGEGAFAGCTDLSAIQVGTNNTAYTAIGGVLFNKAGTELIVYPVGKGGSTYTIPNGVTTIGNGAFANCSGLTSVTIPDSVTSIGEAAFANCSGLTSVTIPDSVTSIGEAAFFGCSDLKSVYVLRDNTGSLTTLGGIDAFYGTHTGLRINVPSGVVDDYKGMDNWSDYADKIQATTP